MRISLRLLRYFAAAAQTGSTTAAARQLNVSQPSISVAIRELEALFEENLFARDAGSKMTLTRFGVRKLAEARQLLAAANAFELDDSGDAASGPSACASPCARSRRCCTGAARCKTLILHSN